MVEAQFYSEYESRAIGHGDNGKPLASASKEEGNVSVTGAPPDGGTRAWLVLAGVGSSVVYICLSVLT